MARLAGMRPEADAAPREITPRAIVLGLGLALLLGSANAYLGLYAGMTVSASIPAAVSRPAKGGPAWPAPMMRASWVFVMKELLRSIKSRSRQRRSA